MDRIVSCFLPFPDEATSRAQEEVNKVPGKLYAYTRCTVGGSSLAKRAEAKLLRRQISISINLYMTFDSGVPVAGGTSSLAEVLPRLAKHRAAWPYKNPAHKESTPEDFLSRLMQTRRRGHKTDGRHLPVSVNSVLAQLKCPQTNYFTRGWLEHKRIPLKTPTSHRA